MLIGSLKVLARRAPLPKKDREIEQENPVKAVAKEDKGASTARPSILPRLSRTAEAAKEDRLDQEKRIEKEHAKQKDEII